MIEVPQSFLTSLIESDTPLDAIWNYLCKNVWVPEPNLTTYFNKNEKKASDFERFVRDIYFEVYDEIIRKSAKGRPRLKEIMKEDNYALAVCDGLSIREANLLVEDLKRNGFVVDEYGYEISHLPSDTLRFTLDVLGVSAPSALRTSSTWKDKLVFLDDLSADYPIPLDDRVLIFSQYPDKEFDHVSTKIGESLVDIYNKTSTSLLKYLRAVKSEKVIITSDHGYCTKHPGVNWKVPEIEKEIYQEVFGLARFKMQSYIFGDMEQKVKEISEKTNRLRILNENVIVNGRYIWPVAGDQMRIFHGGISFMENFVPLIIAHQEG